MRTDYWDSQSPERVLDARKGALRELMFVEDTLAEGLGYARSEGGPEDPNGGGFITGEHTPGSLALEARRRLLEEAP